MSCFGAFCDLDRYSCRRERRPGAGPAWKVGPDGGQRPALLYCPDDCAICKIIRNKNMKKLGMEKAQLVRLVRPRPDQLAHPHLLAGE